MSTDHRDLLKKLVDAPYGKAQEILKKQGLWDERKSDGDPSQMKTYRVRVDGQMSVGANVRVEAASAEEACEKASAIAEDPSFSWTDFGDTEVWNAEVRERS